MLLHSAVLSAKPAALQARGRQAVARAAAPRSLTVAAAQTEQGPRTAASQGKLVRAPFLVGGNWKANHVGIADLVKGLNDGMLAGEVPPNVEAVVAPPFVFLGNIREKLDPKFEIAAQNMRAGGDGAYTGEITAEMLFDINVKWVILGHSERRALFKETNVEVGQKVAYALTHGLRVMACCGETLEERNAAVTMKVVTEQLEAINTAIKGDWTNVVIAYEPVWAIGTGVVASPEQAQEVHAGIRAWLASKIGAEKAADVRMLYGGSVNAKNSRELAKKPDINGFLVGGASLKAPEFLTICKQGGESKLLSDPLEEYCEGNPSEPECIVYDS